MKVKPIRKNTDISDALLDDFFKGDENYAGDVQTEEDERSEHDKHWNGNMLVMQYSNENAQLKAENESIKDNALELVEMLLNAVITFLEKENIRLERENGTILRELLGGEPNAKV